jgi:hypothetical protein
MGASGPAMYSMSGICRGQRVVLRLWEFNLNCAGPKSMCLPKSFLSTEGVYIRGLVRYGGNTVAWLTPHAALRDYGTAYECTSAR